jgi:hypothetical protein
MGAKVIHCSVGISGLSTVLTLICLALPWHTTIWAFQGIPVIGMDTSALTISFPTCSKGTVQGFFVKALPMPSAIKQACGEVLDEDLQTFSQVTCTKAIGAVFPNICTATSQAYVFGISVLIVCGFAILLQGVAAYMAYQYLTGSLKTKYRELWMMLLGTAVFLQLTVLAVYHILVLRNLEGLSVGFGIPISASDGMGCRRAFIGLYVAVGLLVISLILTNWGKLGREDAEEERRENDKFMKEVNNANMYVNPSAASHAEQGQGGVHYGYGAAAPAPFAAGPVAYGIPGPPQPANNGMNPAW